MTAVCSPNAMGTAAMLTARPACASPEAGAAVEVGNLLPRARSFWWGFEWQSAVERLSNPTFACGCDGNLQSISCPLRTSEP